MYWTTSRGKIGRGTDISGDGMVNIQDLVLGASQGTNIDELPWQPNLVTGLNAPGMLVLSVETPVDVETPVVAYHGCSC